MAQEPEPLCAVAFAVALHGHCSGELVAQIRLVFYESEREQSDIDFMHTKEGLHYFQPVS